jgi:hypothetical protein
MYHLISKLLSLTLNDVVCIMLRSHTELSFFFLQLRNKITSATSAIKSVFGQEVQQQDAVSLLRGFLEILCFFIDFQLSSRVLLPFKGQQIGATQRKDGESS